jgi:hypothetical protein
MRRNPERRAWAILLTSLFLCIGLAVSGPLGARYYMLYARKEQNVTLEVQRGPLRVTLAGRGRPVAIAEERDDIPERTIIATDSTSGRLVIHAPQGDIPVIATVQIYDETEVELSSARSPLFPISSLPHRVALQVKSGRVRIGVSSDNGRPTVVEVRTPHGTATLAEGSYEVKVNATTEVTVRHGQADVTNETENTLSLGPGERAIVDAERIRGPHPAARNLVANGDFQTPLENGWVSYNEQKEEPPATVSAITDQGREVASFFRDGTNHAEVGIQQEINYDVRDFSSLELHLAVRILYQNITGFGGCGYLSSECPIMVRMDYKDIYGTDLYWLHGFYTGEPASDWLLYEWVEQIPPGSWQTYDSGNLMEILIDTPPALIKSLTIYASGHSFHAMVTEIELLAQE